MILLRRGLVVIVLISLAGTGQICSQKQSPESNGFHRSISPSEVRQRLEKGDSLVILDVRTKEEFESETGHLSGAILIPVQELQGRYHELDSLKNNEIVAYCRTGRRSARAGEFLAAKGFKVYNMVGGIVEWNKSSKEKNGLRNEAK